MPMMAMLATILLSAHDDDDGYDDDNADSANDDGPVSVMAMVMVKRSSGDGAR